MPCPQTHAEAEAALAVLTRFRSEILAAVRRVTANDDIRVLCAAEMILAGLDLTDKPTAALERLCTRFEMEGAA